MEFEYSILDFIQNNIRSGFLDPIMSGLSYFAYIGIGWIILSLILLIPRKTRVAAAIALCAMTLGVILGEGLIKHLIMRPRPYISYNLFHAASMPFKINGHFENTSGFPSGHTCASFAAAAAYFKINKAAGFSALALALLIAFSRLYNYVHFPSDVLGGMALGIVCALFMMWLFEKTKLDNKLLNIRRKQN